jgi:site-specific recombinase XerD
MEAELNEFLKQLRLRVAASTNGRKAAMLWHFYRHLINRKKHYEDVRQPDVEEYLRSIPGTNKYRREACRGIREFYRFLNVPENPAEKTVFRPDRKRTLPTVPGQPAIARMFTRLAERQGPMALRDRLLAELAYGSGLRRAKLARLDIEDVDLEGKTAMVTGKGEKDRMVPLTSTAVAVMREYLAGRPARGPLLASRRGKRMDTGSIYYVLKYRAGVRPHLLRHACATHLLQNGCGIRAIQQLLGHAGLKSTQIYTFLDKKDLREIVNKNHPRNRA